MHINIMIIMPLQILLDCCSTQKEKKTTVRRIHRIVLSQAKAKPPLNVLIIIPIAIFIELNKLNK